MGAAVLVGGGLRPDNRAVYEAIAAHCGPRLGLFGTASGNPQASLEYNQAIFSGYGLEVIPLAVTTANAAQTTRDPTILRQIEACDGFYFGGGDQRRITQALLGTPALETLKARLANGAGIGGSSAGTAIMTNPMISGGRSLDSWLVQGETLSLEAGLGFLPHLQVDQHFLAWGRFGRLWKALEQQNLPLGVGIDENTTLVVQAGQPWQVLGASHVAVLQRSEAGTFISLLAHGDCFDPYSQTFLIDPSRPPIQNPDPEIGPIFSGDVFAGRVLPNLLSQLVESQHSKAIGLAFAGSVAASFRSRGIRIGFEKTEDTRGFYGDFAPGERNSIVRVRMSLAPIQASVE